MSTFFNHVVAASDGTNLTAITTNSGHTYSLLAGTAGALVAVNNRMHQVTDGGGYEAISSVAAGTDAEYAEMVVRYFSGASDMGVYTRLSSDGYDGYMFIYFGGNWRLYKQFRQGSPVTAGLSLLATVATSSSAVNPSAGNDYTMRITTTNGSGSSVDIVCKVNGSTIHTYTDSTGHTTPGRVGIYSDTTTTSTTGLHMVSLVGVDTAIGGGGSRMFRNNPAGALSGLGSSGPFFQNPLQ